MSASGFTVRISSLPEVQKQLMTLEEDVGNRVTVRALNATVTQSRPRMASAISKEFRVTTTEAKARLDIAKAKQVDGAYRFEAVLSARNKAKGRGMNLIHFAEKVVTLAAARKRRRQGEGGKQTLRTGGQVEKALQIRFQIKRTGGKQMIKGAFIANKGRTMFVRVGKERLPIQALSTIDVTQMFNTKRVNAVVVEFIRQRFPANFERELRAVLKGFV